ncbi:F390 synthetase-related protein [Paenibacillus hodogayensis]|uniref:F390 synthetase-related protein n=1 Tax=Paenibacillus hodogayensis TaxID=279208 RepID=A0ABV5W232_9BACL
MNIADRISVLYHYGMARRKRRWSGREELERWQEARVREHVRRVRRESAFYRELWGDRPSAEWREFPIIDKSVMMEKFDRLNTVGIRKEEAFALALQAERTRDFTPMIDGVTIGLSSGTSGNRGLFLVGRRERRTWAGTVLAKVLPGPLSDGHRIAFFLRADSNLYGTVGGGSLQFAFYDLMDPLALQLARLGKQQPTLLVAPPSMLRLLAEKQKEGKLAIRPERVVSVAETLDPLDRGVVEEVFGQPLHQVYQCTEGFLGATCRHGTLHLNEDVVCVQKDYVDRERRKFVPIITDFSRTTQPIVRYRLNDLLTELEGICPCGSPFMALEAIEGRCDDLYYLPALDGSGWVPVFPDYLARAVMAASPDIEEYQLVLHAPDRLNVRLRVSEALRAEACRRVAETIGELCGTMGCRTPSMEFTDYTFVPGSRKLRRVERRFRFDPDTGLVF